MKKYIVAIVMLLTSLTPTLLKAQIKPPAAISGNRISISYDESGNRVLRHLILLNNARKVTKERDSLGTARLEVFPNPTSDIVNIQITNAKDIIPISVSVMDITGKILLQQNFSANNISLDFTVFAGGTYILKINSTDDESIWNIIKK